MASDNSGNSRALMEDTSPASPFLLAMRLVPLLSKSFNRENFMKVGVFTVILASSKLEKALDYLVGLGVESVEIGAGGYAGTAHCPVDKLLGSDRAASE